MRIRSPSESAFKAAVIGIRPMNLARRFSNLVSSPREVSFSQRAESDTRRTHSGIRPNWTRSCGSTCSSSGLKSCGGESTCPARLTVGALRVGCATGGRRVVALAAPVEGSEAGAAGAGAIRLVKPIEPFDNRACTILSSPTLPRVPTDQLGYDLRCLHAGRDAERDSQSSSADEEDVGRVDHCRFSSCRQA
jgi:hypothetical protein